MHADEAIQADRFGSLLEKHSVLYDPSEHHGPLLSYATLPAAWVARQWRYADLDEWTIRVVPALSGIALKRTGASRVGMLKPSSGVGAFGCREPTIGSRSSVRP